MKRAAFALLLLSTLPAQAQTPQSGQDKAQPAERSYFSAMVKRPGFREAWARLVKETEVTKANPWLANFGGVETPAEELKMGEENLIRATSCEPHNCASNIFVVLASPRVHRIWLAQRITDSAGRKTISYYGAPDESLQAGLVEGFPDN